MRALDRRAASDEFGIPSLALMQSAGEAFARACIEELGGSVKNKRVALVCGRGNNGGDGFVAARHLAGAGAVVDVFLAGRADELKGDAAVFFAPLPHLHENGVRVVQLSEADGATGVAEGVFSRCDLIGDALFGTGFQGAATGVAANLIERMNTMQARGLPVVACDIPSGVNADTGAADGPAVQATRTVTFALPKMGLLLYPGGALAGRVTVADIGLPRTLLLDDENLRAELTTRAWMQKTLPPRTQARDANKGAFGTVLVIAGGHGMAGAASLAALAALRAGAGLVQLAVPASVFSAAASFAPEIITRPLPETSDGTYGGPGALDAALALAEKADAVALGPGLGRNNETTAFVQAFVSRFPKPLIVDADGLNALADSSQAAQSRPAPTVLTPHPGEMGRLLQSDTAAVQSDRLTAARDCAARYHAVTLLKGARTLIAEPEGRLAVNRQGSPALATAGSGDVLTGVIAALLAQKMGALDAARAGAYLHALAGERAARELGAAGVIASDVLHRLPAARQSLYSAPNTDDEDDL